MRKILFIGLTIFTILFMSCENNNDENGGNGKEDKKHYLTISYHSEGHTEGEVPVYQ